MSAACGRSLSSRCSTDRAHAGEGLLGVNVGRLSMGLGGFLVAYVSIKVLISNGFDNALMMVFASGVIASVALMAFQIRANHKR